jgi:hypothetical protein
MRCAGCAGCWEWDAVLHTWRNRLLAIRKACGEVFAVKGVLSFSVVRLHPLSPTLAGQALLQT